MQVFNSPRPRGEVQVKRDPHIALQSSKWSVATNRVYRLYFRMHVQWNLVKWYSYMVMNQIIISKLVEAAIWITNESFLLEAVWVPLAICCIHDNCMSRMHGCQGNKEENRLVVSPEPSLVPIIWWTIISWLNWAAGKMRAGYVRVVRYSWTVWPAEI